MCFEVAVKLRRGDAQVAVHFAGLGRLTALWGRSGVGKSSVLDMVAGLLRPDEGRIVVDGRVLFDSAEGIDLPPHARGCGYVFQDRRLFPHLSVERNLMYGWRLSRPDERWIEPAQVHDLLGIGPLLKRRVRHLSGGEAQRVAIGRALLSGARFLLMDEPLTALDAARREEVLQAIERVRDGLDMPILYVSHDRGEVERLASLIVRMGH